MKQHVCWVVVAMSLIAVAPTSAQSTEGHPSDSAAGVLTSLPPDLHKKLQQLSQLIDRPYLREDPAGFSLERLATAFMNSPG